MVLRFVKGDDSAGKEFPAAATDAQRWLKLPFRAPNSISRAYILALAAMRPRNLTTGSCIDTAVALSRFNKKEFHHVYPRAHLKRQRAPGEHNAIANICMLGAADNLRICDQDPHAYLPRCLAELGQDARDVFASNLLPDPADLDYADASYSDFLVSRSCLIASVVADLCRGSRQFQYREDVRMRSNRL